MSIDPKERALARWEGEGGAALEAAAAPPSHQAPVAAGYVCPMHPQIKSDQPGSCAKCGMTLELEPELPSVDDEQTGSRRL
jgi:Cu+-exporting ATPase